VRAAVEAPIDAVPGARPEHASLVWVNEERVDHRHQSGLAVYEAFGDLLPGGPAVVAAKGAAINAPRGEERRVGSRADGERGHVVRRVCKVPKPQPPVVAPGDAVDPADVDGCSARRDNLQLGVAQAVVARAP
jgi:hypothetical protein